MKKIKNMWLYLWIIACGFYLLPLFMKNTGIAMIILLVAFPVLIIAVSAVFGLKHKFSLLYSLLVAILFLPTTFMYYNSSAFIYGAVYGFMALAGNGIGRLCSGDK